MALLAKESYAVLESQLLHSGSVANDLKVLSASERLKKSNILEFMVGFVISFSS